MSSSSKIIEFLKRNGPVRSSTMKQFLMSSGMSDIAGRQAISRSPKNV